MLIKIADCRADASISIAATVPVAAAEAVERRRKLREAMLALSNSDAFVDLLGRELLAGGLLPL